jgi:hypothetical protein
MLIPAVPSNRNQKINLPYEKFYLKAGPELLAGPKL